MSHPKADRDLLSVIILTHNEMLNLRHAVESVRRITPNVYVVDSFSNDGTPDLARDLGAMVVQHEFVTQATQVNWALDNLPISTPWVMRLDADERVTPELGVELLDRLPSLSESVTGIEVKRRVYFMNRWIRNGGYYPTWLMRVWRRGQARSEDRWMDEHIVLTSGEAVRAQHDIIDWNQKGLQFFIEKHLQFASREANDILDVPLRMGGGEVAQPSLNGRQDMRKRWLKNRIYQRAPLFARTGLYFGYRYFLRLGFLDGREGLVFHFLQGWWYRFLVDAIVFERLNVKPKVRSDDEPKYNEGSPSLPTSESR